ncbi:hypothetical protein ACSSWA_01880 [Melioribacter sp. Ez-97]|uniref:hypothetical protein n=1 Tax=Melioribacter sp. Ez-97 TaxID=3423434 RepID=UPI003EDA8C81
MNLKLKKLDKTLKLFLAAYLIALTAGVSIGVLFVRHTTHMSTEGVVERFAGSQSDDEFDIQEAYPKPISELIITTHNHILGLSFVFFTVGLIFYFNSLIDGKWKVLLMTEPLISLLISFGSIWLIRFYSPSFVYLTFISSLLMFASFYVMVAVSFFEICFIKK